MDDSDRNKKEWSFAYKIVQVLSTVGCVCALVLLIAMTIECYLWLV